MSWALFLVYAIVLLYLVYRVRFFRLPGLPAWMPPAFFVAKIFAGIALWAIYTFYYTERQSADIWKYFDDSAVMYNALHDHPADYFKMVSGIGDSDPRIDQTYYHTMQHWYQQFDNNLLNDAHIIIRFNAVLRMFSLGNYHTHSLFMSFLAFIGLCGIYRVLYGALKQWPKLTAFCIFLLPSLLFWGSGVMKEGLMLLGLGGMIYQAFAFFSDKTWWRLPLFVFFAWLVFMTKFYVLAALIPALAGAFWVIRKPRFALLKFLFTLIVFAAIGLSVKFVHPAYDPLRVLAWKQNDFLKLGRGGTYLLSDSVVAFINTDHRDDLVKESDSVYHIRPGANYIYWYYDPDFSDTVYAQNSHDKASYKILTDFPRAGSFMETKMLQPDIFSFVKASPQALFRSLMRPFIWEGKNLLLLFPALENLLMLLLFALAVFYFRKPASSALLGFCFCFAFLLLLVMGLTTPVLGALVRYRIAAQPFLLLALLMLIDKEKIFRRKDRISS